jgi:hypothetical protein
LQIGLVAGRLSAVGAIFGAATGLNVHEGT